MSRSVPYLPVLLLANRVNKVLDFLHTANFHLTDLWPAVPDAEYHWNAAQSYHLITVCNLIWFAAYLLLTLFLLHRARSHRESRMDPTEFDHGDYPHISVVIPARNEAQNLPYVLPRIPSFVTEVILVDGHSEDETIAMAMQLLPTIHIIKQRKKGKGDALRLGFAACSGDIIVMLDADGSADPSEIAKFVEALLDGNDFAKGSRFLEHAGSSDLTWLRRLGCLGFISLVNFLFRTKFSDLCYGYNAFWRYCLDSVEIDCDGFEVETLINIRMHKENLKIVEVPSTEYARLYGKSHLNTFLDGWRVFKTIVKERCTFSTPSQVCERVISKEI